MRRLELGDAVARLAVIGTVDEATSDVLVAAIRDALTSTGIMELVVDLGGTTCLDRYGMAALQTGNSLAQRSGVDFRVVNGPVESMLFVTRIATA